MLALFFYINSIGRIRVFIVTFTESEGKANRISARKFASKHIIGLQNRRWAGLKYSSSSVFQIIANGNGIFIGKLQSVILHVSISKPHWQENSEEGNLLINEGLTYKLQSPELRAELEAITQERAQFKDEKMLDKTGYVSICWNSKRIE